MNRSKLTRCFGLFLAVAIAMNDLDAMRAHVAAHSWLTLSYVAVFLVGHVTDYLTIGRIIDRMNFEVL